MSFCPLWSAAVGHPREPISNAPAENHFRQVKSNLKPGVKKCMQKLLEADMHQFKIYYHAWYF